MPLRLPTLTRALMLCVAIATLAASCTSSAEESTTRPTASAGEGAAPTPAVPSFELVVDLRDVRAVGVDQRVRTRDLREPAQAIRRTMTELYSIAFVDPARWEDGAFPSMFRLFSGEARSEAERDVRRLTLGSAARELDAVKPRRARLDVRFLTDARGRPVVATADVSFEGTGLAGDARPAIRQDGEYTLRRINGSWRIVAYDVTARVVGEPGEAAFAPGFPSRGPTFVLVIGSDARPGQSVTRTRADSLHIVGVNPREGRASVLGIPRDSWVPIPGAGSAKINAALAIGGPDLVVQTVERLTGISIDAYVLTGFQGFEAIVDEIGGIDIDIPYPISDRYAHARFDAGPEHLSANEALAFSRARHALADGDFGRSLNQGRLLIAALATLHESVSSRGIAALFPWAVAGARRLHTDLSFGDMIDLLLAAPAFAPGGVSNDVATGRVGSVGGQSVVFLDGGAFARFRDLARDGVLGG